MRRVPQCCSLLRRCLAGSQLVVSCCLMLRSQSKLIMGVRSLTNQREQVLVIEKSILIPTTLFGCVHSYIGVAHQDLCV